jgi:hypothetical protein
MNQKQKKKTALTLIAQKDSSVPIVELHTQFITEWLCGLIPRYTKWEIEGTPVQCTHDQTIGTHAGPKRHGRAIRQWIREPKIEVSCVGLWVQKQGTRIYMYHNHEPLTHQTKNVHS